MADPVLEEAQGRKAHLGRLAIVFYHRGATWADFWNFLDDFLSNRIPLRANCRTHSMGCRHGPGGKHELVLQGLTSVGADSAPAPFNRLCYREPCLGFGAGEKDKSPGFVVSDLCKKARSWLEARGKGGIIRHTTSRTNRDLGQGEDLIWPGSLQLDAEVLPWVGHTHPEVPAWSEQVLTHSQAWAIFVDHLGEDEVNEILRDNPSALSRIYESTAGESDSDPEDLTVTGTAEVDRLMSDTLLSSDRITATPQRSDSATTRTSTKVRVPTLAYLRGVSNDVSAFRTRFYQLREERLAVLHLCGCGLRFTNTENTRGDTACSGCVQSSHLVLGTIEANTEHRYWHTVINRAAVPDYQQLCEIAWRSGDGQSCDGIF